MGRTVIQPRHAVVSGWARYPSVETDLYRVERVRELHELVRQDVILPRGLGRSYGDAALSHGALVLMERLDRFLAFDEATGILRCESGTSIAQLLDFAIPRGFFPYVVPGTRHVTIGGAIACDIHGKNHHRDGSFGAGVVEFDLLTADGELRRCSRTSNADLFHATIGGLGLTGVITDASIRLVRVASPHVRVRTDACAALAEAFEHFATDDDSYAYSVAWIDGMARGGRLGRSVLLRANHLQADELDRRAAPKRNWSVPRWWPPQLLNRSTGRTFNALYYARHRNQTESVSDYQSYFFQLDRLTDWHRLYGQSGFAQYQFVVPEAGAQSAIALVLRMLAEAHTTPFLGVLKRMGPGDPDQLLSFPIAGYTLAVDLPLRDSRMFQLMHELDAVVADHGGRIYLAKDARARAGAVATMYAAGLNRWRAVKASVDPQNRFRSLLSERLELTG